MWPPLFVVAMPPAGRTVRVSELRDGRLGGLCSAGPGSHSLACRVVEIGGDGAALQAARGSANFDRLEPAESEDRSEPGEPEAGPVMDAECAVGEVGAVACRATRRLHGGLRLSARTHPAHSCAITPFMQRDPGADVKVAIWARRGIKWLQAAVRHDKLRDGRYF